MLEDYDSKWATCQKCPLHCNRAKPVLYRGSIPCEIAFLTEAPGDLETKTGMPLQGRPGELLDQLMGTLSRELSIYGVTCRWMVVSMTACPTKRMSKATEEQLLTCKPHITELLRLAKPKVLIPLGKVAEAYSKQVFKGAKEEKVTSPWYWEKQGGVRSDAWRNAYNRVSKVACRIYAKEYK
jgi:uracil-DNA glycosylase family 4